MGLNKLSRANKEDELTELKWEEVLLIYQKSRKKHDLFYLTEKQIW